MVDDSRIGVYDYLEEIFTSVTENVYLMDEPQELTQSDTEDGFVVISLGDMVDASEFQGSTYGMIRAYVRCYVPPMTRGRLNKELYKKFEDDINAVVKLASESDNQYKYWIETESFISADLGDDSNKDNAFFVFVKSFIVVVDDETVE